MSESRFHGVRLGRAAGRLCVKGTQWTLRRREVEGQDATVKAEHERWRVRQLWVDTQTFLEVKSRASPPYGWQDARCRDLLPRLQVLNSLVVPYVLETTVQGSSIAQDDHRERGW